MSNSKSTPVDTYTFSEAQDIFFSIKAGDVKLQLNNRKNIFYAEDVCAFEILPNYENLIGIDRVDFDDHRFATHGNKITPLEVEIDTKDTIICGSYSNSMPIDELSVYRVKIYIIYQVEQ